ncbi:MAG: hypothetical protein EOO36_16580 [Cytophagaceae bacterium]|nr:MAG: hypothetical protein EOO36_16580 [Cytophagaceae bacterium]
MLRSLCLPLLGLALLAKTAVAQTTPATRKTTTTKTTAPRQVSNTTPAARRANPLRGTNDNGVGQSGYAAPGEPITDPRYNGKNTPPYDGAAAPAKRNTTISAPK